MYRALTAKPEDPNGVYLAQENSSKRSGLGFCFHMGCTVLEDMPGFTIQRIVRVPCGPAALVSAEAAVVPQAVVVNVQCGKPGAAEFDRDCLPSEADFADFDSARADVLRQHAAHPVRFYRIFSKDKTRLLFQI